MATQISRDILNKETNARFWAQTGYKPGQRLDPNNPLDKAKMPVWMDIFRKVNAEADAGTLVTTWDRPEVAQPLADAEVAQKVATIHVDAGAKASDPDTAQQHVSAAMTAQQVAALKLKEAAQNQPPTVSPKLVDDAAREAARTPPPPNAPAIDQIAHAQMQNGKNGQNGKMLAPEEDPWSDRYVPKSERPQPQPQPQPQPLPSRPSRERPPSALLYKETNARFWNRTRYKPGQKLDMTDPQDRKMSKTWLEILREVEREADAGTLTFTSPEVPTPDGARPPPPRPMPLPPAQQPMPPRPMPPPMQQPLPQQPMPPRPMPPPMQQPLPQQPMPPRPMPQRPMPQRPMPLPGMQQPWPSPPGMQPGQQPWPSPPGMQRPMPPPGMQWPPPPGMQPGMQRPMPPPGMQQPMQPMQPMQPVQPTGTRPPPSMESTPPMPAPTEGASPPADAPAPMPETSPTGMSMPLKIGLGLGALGVLGTIIYAVTRKPSGARGRARATARVSSGGGASIGTSALALPASRGGRF